MLVTFRRHHNESRWLFQSIEDSYPEVSGPETNAMETVGDINTQRTKMRNDKSRPQISIQEIKI